MENEKELNRRTERASMVRAMVDTPGWKEVIKPALTTTCHASLDNFRAAKTPDELQKAQFGLLAAEFLLAIPEVVIAEGVEANEALEELKKSE